MMRFIRLFNLALCAVVVWQGLLLMQSKPVFAQAAPFLYRPYYGNFPGFSASFDHHFPVNTDNNVFTRWQGNSLYSPPHDISVNDGDGCSVDGSNCYDGHDGYDILLAYEPVVAAADGQVDYAGWKSTNHATDLGLTVGINHSNNYRTVYGHLSMVRYPTGTNVGRWQIGTSGTTGNSTGPHLHFQVERYYNSQWRVTDPYGWRDQSNNNDNGDDPWAGDANGVTSTWLWVANPLQSPPPNNGTTTMDDGDAGFTSQCFTNPPAWQLVSPHSSGYLNDFRWIAATGNTTYNCSSTWNFNFPSAGEYEVEVRVPMWEPTNRSHSARYVIFWADNANPTITRSTTVVMDQHRIGYPTNSCSGGDCWISLGRYNFRQGVNSNGFVSVTNAAFIGTYTDPNSLKVVVDAMRVIKTN
jgi:murein DD-endopeptidase MepM/ murein hydrolase activator NlpD